MAADSKTLIFEKDEYTEEQQRPTERSRKHIPSTTRVKNMQEQQQSSADHQCAVRNLQPRRLMREQANWNCDHSKSTAQPYPKLDACLPAASEKFQREERERDVDRVSNR